MCAIRHWTGASSSIHVSLDSSIHQNLDTSIYKTLNTGQRGAFVIGQVEDGIEADHFQEHSHALGRRKVGRLAPGTLKGGKSADQGANSGAVEFGDAGEIHGDAHRAAVDEFLDFVAKSLFRVAQFQSAIKVQDGGVTCFTNADIHMSLTAVAKLTELGPPIKAAV